MKKLLLLIGFLFSLAVHAQVIMHSGTVMTNSDTFYDSGGAAGDYGASEAYVLTFCPLTPGTYIQLDFSNFELEGFPFDYMTIYNGSGTGGTVIGQYGDSSPSCDLIASSDPSGCITVRFESDGSLQYGGWMATVSTTTTPGGVPVTAPSNAVCDGANPFCADSGALQFPNMSDGCVDDAPAVITANSCLITAPNPTWYYLEIGVAGPIDLEIEQTTGPNGTGTGLDVDYVIWGPFASIAATCADFTQGDCVADHDCSGNVVDCSYSPDPVETATIPNALVGQIYMVLVTNFDGAPGYITMTQTNPGPGAGTTNCAIVCPTFAGTNPSTCGATNGSIMISGLDPNTAYTVTYLDDGSPASSSQTSNASGQIVISGLNAGNYTNLITNYPGCASAVGNVTLVAATAPSIISITTNSPICSGAGAVFTIRGTANATLTFNINGGPNQTIALDAGGDASVVVTPALANVTLNTISISIPGCSAPVALTRTVTVSAAATLTLTSAAPTAAQTICANTAITNISYAVAGGATNAGVTGLPAGITGNFAGGIFTISGTPTVSGIFNYTVTTTGGCGTDSETGSITINPAVSITLSSAAGTNAQTVCINSAIANITYAVTDATGATVVGLPAGITGNFAGGIFTISGTPTVSGIFNYTVTTTGGCGIDSETGSMTINPAVSVALSSAAGTNTQTGCINSAIANITYAVTDATGATVVGLPAGVTGSFAGGVFTISGTPTVSGIFNYTVTTTGGCGTDSEIGSIAINPAVSITLSSVAGTNAQTVCINSAITDITYTVTDATGATVVGLPAGVTGSFAGGIFTISGTPTVSGIFNYTVTTTGGCGTDSEIGSIAINPAVSITLSSVAGTNTQTVCINSAITDITYTVTDATGATVVGLPAGVTGSFAGGIFTISGTPTVSGIFNYTVTTTGGCGIDSEIGSITINSDATLVQTSTAGTETQTVCLGTPITTLTYATGAGATGATVLGLPPGITGLYVAGVLTISGTATVSGTFNFTVTATGSSCASPSLSGILTINPNAALALTSSAATTAQAVCINANIADITYAVTNAGTTVSGLPAGVTGTFNAGIFTISGAPTVSGIFNYTVSTTSGCGLAALSGSITVGPDAAMILTSAAGTDAQTLCVDAILTDIVYTVAGGATNAAATGLPNGTIGTFNSLTNEFTVSGSPSEVGTFNYSVTTSGGCGSVSLNGILTILPLATITQVSALGTEMQTVCINTAIASIEYAPADGATGAAATGLPAGVSAGFSGGIFTISGTPTVSGIFNYTVTTTGGCGLATLGGILTIGPDVTMALTSAAGTEIQTVCINTAIADITYTTGSGATDATVSGLPTGLAGNYSSGIFTITGIPTATGTFTYTVTATGGCGPASLGGTITVSPDMTIALASAVGTDDQSLCVNTAISTIEYATANGVSSITAFGLPVGVNGIFNNATGVFTISGTPLFAGVYSYTLLANGGCGSPTIQGFIIVNPDINLVYLPGGSDMQTVCINTPIIDIRCGTANSSAASLVFATGLPTGLTASFVNEILTISGIPTQSGVFNYTVTADGPCGFKQLTGTITVNADASIVLSSAAGTDAQTVCIGSPIASVSYAISGGATGASAIGLPAGLSGNFAAGVFTISGSPTVSGTFNFTVTATGSGCTSASLSGSLIVQPQVSLALTSAVMTTTQTVCIATGITPIVYTVGNGALGAIVSGLPAGVSAVFAAGSVTISGIPTLAGIFNYTITTSGGCGSEALSGTITVQPDVTLILSSAAGSDHQLLCIGTPIVPITYLVTNGLGATVSGLPAGVATVYAAGILTISGIPITSGEFNYTVTTTGGCGLATAGGSLSVNPDTTLALTSVPGLANQVLCINSALLPIIYTVGNGGTNATASGLPPGVNGIFNNTTGVFTLSGTPTTGGLFNYTVTTSGGCGIASLSGSITVNLPATAAFHYPNSPYCATVTVPQSGILSGTGMYTGGNFAAAPGLSLNASNGAINPSLSAPGNYTVTYEIPASGGCQPAPISASISITAAPTVAISYNGPFCTSVAAAQAVTIVGTNSYTGGVFTSAAGLSLNPVTGAINPSLSTPGNYTVTYHTLASGGCASVPASAIVRINATPDVIAPSALSICSEVMTSINLTSSVTGTVFNWTVVQNNASGASAGSGNNITQTLTTTGNGLGTAIYTIVPSTADCSGSPFIVTVTVNPLPVAQLVGGVICRNPASGVVERTLWLDSGLNDAVYDFVWTHNSDVIAGANSGSYEADEAGTYSVVAAHTATGCVSHPAMAVVTESEVAKIALINGNEAFVENPVITVTVQGSGNYLYQLDNGAPQSSNVFANINMGEHTIRITDADDCTDIVQTFTLIGYPKFFTPNADGYNDTWNIWALAGQSASKISIFDRYGKLVKQIAASGDGWDGTYNGQPLPATDYWFVVEYADGLVKKEFKAHFALKR